MYDSSGGRPADEQPPRQPGGRRAKRAADEMPPDPYAPPDSEVSEHTGQSEGRRAAYPGGRRRAAAPPDEPAPPSAPAQPPPPAPAPSQAAPPAPPTPPPPPASGATSAAQPPTGTPGSEQIQPGRGKRAAYPRDHPGSDPLDPLAGGSDSQGGYTTPAGPAPTPTGGPTTPPAPSAPPAGEGSSGSPAWATGAAAFTPPANTEALPAGDPLTTPEITGTTGAHADSSTHAAPMPDRSPGAETGGGHRGAPASDPSAAAVPGGHAAPRTNADTATSSGAAPPGAAAVGPNDAGQAQATPAPAASSPSWSTDPRQDSSTSEHPGSPQSAASAQAAAGPQQPRSGVPDAPATHYAPAAGAAPGEPRGAGSDSRPTTASGVAPDAASPRSPFAELEDDPYLPSWARADDEPAVPPSPGGTRASASDPTSGSAAPPATASAPPSTPPSTGIPGTAPPEAATHSAGPPAGAAPASAAEAAAMAGDDATMVGMPAVRPEDSAPASGASAGEHGGGGERRSAAAFGVPPNPAAYGASATGAAEPDSTQVVGRPVEQMEDEDFYDAALAPRRRRPRGPAPATAPPAEDATLVHSDPLYAEADSATASAAASTPAAQSRRRRGLAGAWCIAIQLVVTLGAGIVEAVLTEAVGAVLALAVVLSSLFVAIVVRRRFSDAFAACVFPPFALAITLLVLSLTLLAGEGTPFWVTTLSGLRGFAWPLVSACAVCIGAIAVRVALATPTGPPDEPAEEPREPAAAPPAAATPAPAAPAGPPPPPPTPHRGADATSASPQPGLTSTRRADHPHAGGTDAPFASQQPQQPIEQSGTPTTGRRAASPAQEDPPTIAAMLEEDDGPERSNSAER